MASGDNKAQWYSEKLDSLDDSTRTLLEKYSGIKPDRVIPHILELVCLPYHHCEYHRS